ncbi:MAG: hypothetical protein JNM40_14940 [Myxococcales bacterium]|nr:hypothetical protein [Myxococcales bacterium]
MQVVRKLASPLVSAAALILLLTALLGASSSSLGSSLSIAPSVVVEPPTRSFFLPPAPLQEAPAPSQTFLGMDDELLLDRLRYAEIRSVHFSKGGSSLVLRIEFSDGSRAAFKPQQINPQSVPRKEAAAYQLARKLGIAAVPPTVMRAISRQELLDKLDAQSQWIRARLLREAIFDDDGRTVGSMMYWVPSLADLHLDSDAAVRAWTTALSQQGPLSDDRSELLAQLSTLLAFDVIQNNSDRFSGGNILGSRDGRTMFFIDNAFGFQNDPRGHLRALGYLQRCQKFSRRLWTSLQLLSDEDLVFHDPVTGPLLSADEVAALRSRRDRVVRYLTQLIHSHGEAAVLAFR